MSHHVDRIAPAICLPKVTRLGWIGTGVMGRSMCGRLLDAGFSVTLFTRSPEKAQDLLARGAQWAASPRAAAQVSDVVFSIVGYPEDVREVVLGEQGVLRGLLPGSILVDCTTSDPALAIEIDKVGRSHRVWCLDAPVSGGDIGAREGRLTVMVGGDDAVRLALAECWKVLASNVVACGPAGNGQHTKLVNQIAIASGMIGVCEAMLYAHQAGLDLEKTLAAISPGAAGSWSLSNLAPRIVNGNFSPGFMVEHFVKDMGLALLECRRMRLSLPGLELAHSLYESLQQGGHGRLGTQSLVLALAKISQSPWPKLDPSQIP